MLFRVSAELEYVARFPSTLILNIQAQRNASQVILDEQLTVEPRIKVAEFTDAADNRFLRLETGRAQEPWRSTTRRRSTATSRPTGPAPSSRPRSPS